MLAFTLVPGVFNIVKAGEPKPRKYKFQKVTDKKFLAPVIRVTPDDGYYQQTYFDVCPFSPSQKYLVTSKFPFQDRMPVQGDLAEVCIIDLENETIRTVYTTRSWGLQTGTNAQWGNTDQYVYCNDVINGTAVCVRVDITTGESTAFCGPMYSIKPDDASCVVGFPLEYFDVTQLGYGCPPVKLGEYKSLPQGASTTEGIWRTDLKTNTKKLIVSLADAAAMLPTQPPFKNYTFYFWHSKFNRQGTRVYQVLRCIDNDLYGKGKIEHNPVNLTFKPDGSELYYTTPNYPVFGSVGGHPNWHGDGIHLVRHLKLEDGKDYFVKFKYDGSTFEKMSLNCEGGGHPSAEPTGRFLITDSQRLYPDHKTVSLRLVDLHADQEVTVCTLPTLRWESFAKDNVFRIDGHPVWSRDYRRVSIQASDEKGARQLYIIDLTQLMQ